MGDYMELSLLQRLTEASELEALADSREELRLKKNELSSLRSSLKPPKSTSTSASPAFTVTGVVNPGPGDVSSSSTVDKDYALTQSKHRPRPRSSSPSNAYARYTNGSPSSRFSETLRSSSPSRLRAGSPGRDRSRVIPPSSSSSSLYGVAPQTMQRQHMQQLLSPQVSAQAIQAENLFDSPQRQQAQAQAQTMFVNSPQAYQYPHHQQQQQQQFNQQTPHIQIPSSGSPQHQQNQNQNQYGEDFEPYPQQQQQQQQFFSPPQYHSPTQARRSNSPVHDHNIQNQSQSHQSQTPRNSDFPDLSTLLPTGSNDVDKLLKQVGEFMKRGNFGDAGGDNSDDGGGKDKGMEDTVFSRSYRRDFDGRDNGYGYGYGDGEVGSKPDPRSAASNYSNYSNPNTNTSMPPPQQQQPEQLLTQENTYKILSCAYKIMEGERTAFKNQLVTVETFFNDKLSLNSDKSTSTNKLSSKLENVTDYTVNCMIKNRNGKLVHRVFAKWKSKVITVKNMRSLEEMVISSKTATSSARVSRITKGAKRVLARKLLALVRRVFCGWMVEVGRVFRGKNYENYERVRSIEVELSDFKLSSLHAAEVAAEVALNRTMNGIKRWTTLLLMHTYSTWVLYTQRRKHAILTALRFKKRVDLKNVKNAFKVWFEHAQQSTLHNNWILERLVMKFKRHVVVRVLNTWKFYVSATRAARRVVARWLTSNVSRALSSAWNVWITSMRAYKVNEAAAMNEAITIKLADTRTTYEAHKHILVNKVMQHFIFKREATKVWKVWNTWFAYVLRRKYMKNIVTNMLKNNVLSNKCNGVHSSFNTWVRNVRTVTSSKNHADISRLNSLNVQHEEREEQLSLALYNLKAEHILLRSTLTQAQLSKKDLGLKFANSVILKWRNSTLLSVYYAWKEYVSTKHKHTRLILRLKSRFTSSVTIRVFERWASSTRTRKRDRTTILRFTTRWRNMCAFKSIRTWREYVDVRVRMREFVARMIRGKARAFLGSAWCVWRGYVEGCVQDEEEEDERRRSRNIGLKVMQTMISSLLTRLLKRWIEHTSIVKHERLIITRFALRLSKRGAIHAINTWKEYVDTRMRLRRLVKRWVTLRDSNDTKSCFEAWRIAVRRMRDGEVCLRIAALQASISTLVEAKDTLELRYTDVQTKLSSSLAHSVTMSANYNEDQAKLKAKLTESYAKNYLLDAKLSTAVLTKRELGVKNAHSMLAMWSNQTLYRTYQAWKIDAGKTARGKKIARRIFSKCLNKSMASAYASWQNFVQVERKHERIIRKVALRIVGLLKAKVFATWVEYWVSRKQHKVLVKRFRARMLHVLEGKAFASWSSFVSSRSSARRVCRRIIARVENAALSNGFVKWTRATYKSIKHEALTDVERVKSAAHDARVKRSSTLVLRALQRFANAGVANAFQKWTAFVQVEKRNVAIIGRFVRRWKGNVKLRCYLTWIDYVVDRRALRNTVRKFMGGREMVFLSGGFNTWLAYTKSANEQEQEQERVRVETKMKDMEVSVERLQESADANSRHALSRGEALARTMFAKLSHGALGMCFLSWRSTTTLAVTARRRLRLVVGRLANAKGGKARAFKVWCRLVVDSTRSLLGEKTNEAKALLSELHLHRDEARSVHLARIGRIVNTWKQKDLTFAFTLWKTCVDEVTRQEYLIHKYTHRIMHQTTAKVLTRWRGYVSEVKRYRVIVKRYRIRMLNVSLTKVLRTWTDYVETIQEKRKLTIKVLRRLANVKVAQAFNSWVYKVEQVKHDERVVFTFGRRWRMMSVYKLFRGWVAYVVAVKGERSLSEEVDSDSVVIVVGGGGGAREVMPVGMEMENALSVTSSERQMIPSTKETALSVASSGQMTTTTTLPSSGGQITTLSNSNQMITNLSSNSGQTTTSTSSTSSGAGQMVMTAGVNSAGMHRVGAAVVSVSGDSMAVAFGIDLPVLSRLQPQPQSQQLQDRGRDQLHLATGTPSINTDPSPSSAESSTALGWCTPKPSFFKMNASEITAFQDTQFTLHRANSRREFIGGEAINNEQFTLVDRTLLVSSVLRVIAKIDDVSCKSVTRLLRCFFLNHNYTCSSLCLEMGFKNLVLSTALNRRLKYLGVTSLFRTVAKAEGKLKTWAFGKIKVMVFFVHSQIQREEFHLKTKARLESQAAQLMKVREKSLRIARTTMLKWTESSRQNILAKCFNAFKRVREIRNRSLALVKRWVLLSVNGGMVWAFQTWKLKSSAAAAYADTRAFLNTRDAETRARLAFILNHHWGKLEAGGLGRKGNERGDVRKVFTTWKIKSLRMRRRELGYGRVERVNGFCGEVLKLARRGGAGRSGSGNGKSRKSSAKGNDFAYDEVMYSTLKNKLDELCNDSDMIGTNTSDESDEDADANSDSEENDTDTDTDTGNNKKTKPNNIKCCIVLVDPTNTLTKNNLLIHTNNAILSIPSSGIIGSILDSGRFTHTSEILKDVRYDGYSDDFVLGACGREVERAERDLAFKFQSDRVDLDWRGEEEEGRKKGGVGKRIMFPDLAFMGMPIVESRSRRRSVPVAGVEGGEEEEEESSSENKILGVVVAIGKAEQLDENIARGLSLMATVVCGWSCIVDGGKGLGGVGEHVEGRRSGGGSPGSVFTKARPRVRHFQEEN